MIETKAQRRYALWLIGAMTALFIGCATTESVVFMPEHKDAPRASDPAVEEIIVTGSRAPGTAVVRQGAFALKAHPLAGIDDVLAYGGDEEIWVIQKPDVSEAKTPDTAQGTGSLTTLVDSVTVPLPLRHTDVSAQINGYISAVNVRQEFSNPYDSKIEAVYVFPLPEKAAITEFVMTIGDRKIRGILREKEEAKEIYEAARSQGYRASLLVQHRPNIFEQKVANIEPGKSIDIEIKYFHTLAYSDGWYSFVFPTVVGPRYNPPSHDDPIHAVPRHDTATSGTAVHYLRPDERSGHDISIEVKIDAGVKIEKVRSTHKIVAQRPEHHLAFVQLANQATLPNRDFLLEFKVAGSKMKSNMLTFVDPKTQQGYFTLMLHPPKVTKTLARRNMEMVFVIDASGSMSGTPIEQAKDAVRATLDHLQEGDTFQIIRFSDNASQFGRVPVPVTAGNVRRAHRYLDNLNGGGGTQMIEGIRAALDFPHDPSRLRFVSFLTDGYIGNETEILGAVATRIGAARIFSFGVGSSVNRYLMERLAKAGRGAVAYLGPQDSGYEVMQGFFDRVSHPALTDVEIDWQGMAVSDVYPARLPDVFVGRPIVVTGKFQGASSEVIVSGDYDDNEQRIVVGNDANASAAPYLAKVWARLRIADLSDRLTWSPDTNAEFANEIRTTALQHQLMSDYTSFVAVDSSATTRGDHGTTVHQAVPVPAGVRYETTVGQ